MRAAGPSPNLRESSPGDSPRSSPGRAAASPPARRAVRPSWRDPRLLVGVVIVAASALAGGRVLAVADDTVEVWSLRTDLAAGATVSDTVLVRQEVRFVSPILAERYLAATDTLPSGTVLARDVGAGELLPRDALTDGVAREYVEVPLAVSADAVPVTLRVGETVDVWVTSKNADDEARAIRVLQEVRVVAVPRDGSAFGPAATRQVVIGVPAGDDDRLAAALARLSSGSAVVVRRR